MHAESISQLAWLLSAARCRPGMSRLWALLVPQPRHDFPQFSELAHTIRRHERRADSACVLWKNGWPVEQYHPHQLFQFLRALLARHARLSNNPATVLLLWTLKCCLRQFLLDQATRKHSSHEGAHLAAAGRQPSSRCQLLKQRPPRRVRAIAVQPLQGNT